MERRKNLLLVILSFVLGLSLSSLAQQNARLEIEDAYAKRWKSAEILNLYGMRHARSDDFTCTDSNGESVDMDRYYASWSRMMAQVIKAEWTGKIISFEVLNGTKARVKAADRFDVLLRDPRYTSQAVSTTISLSEDIWELRDGVWLQTHSNILKQAHKQAPYVVPSEVKSKGPVDSSEPVEK